MIEVLSYKEDRSAPCYRKTRTPFQFFILTTLALGALGSFYSSAADAAPFTLSSDAVAREEAPTALPAESEAPATAPQFGRQSDQQEEMVFRAPTGTVAEADQKVATIASVAPLELEIREAIVESRLPKLTVVHGAIGLDKRLPELVLPLIGADGSMANNPGHITLSGAAPNLSLLTYQGTDRALLKIGFAQLSIVRWEAEQSEYLTSLITLARVDRREAETLFFFEEGQLSDEELSEVMAGEFQMNLENFDVRIQDNQAGYFTLDIAQNAFRGSQGVFTTLQTVNSAVDLTVIVNIYLPQQYN